MNEDYVYYWSEICTGRAARGPGARGPGLRFAGRAEKKEVGHGLGRAWGPGLMCNGPGRAAGIRPVQITAMSTIIQHIYKSVIC